MSQPLDEVLRLVTQAEQPPTVGEVVAARANHNSRPPFPLGAL